MTKTLVERLKEARAHEYYKPSLIIEATAEIERLRNGLERLKAAHEHAKEEFGACENNWPFYALGDLIDEISAGRHSDEP